MTLAELLTNLPSRGYLTSVEAGALFSKAPVPYIADHDTAPPPDKVVKTDPASTLIKSFAKKPASDEAKKKAKAAKPDKGKRPAEDANAGGAAKRAALVAPSNDDAGPSGASNSVVPPAESTYTREALMRETLAQLKPILKAWKLPLSGKKEELVTRILDKQAEMQGKHTG